MSTKVCSSVAEAMAAVRDDPHALAAAATETAERIEHSQDEIAAFVRIDNDVVRERIHAAGAGSLAGVQIAVKDLVDTADELSEYGSSIYAGNQPENDAEVVKILRREGAVIVGKTVTTEFALFAPPKTNNPHDHSRTPGGSSSGSAAAVAAGLVPIAIGTQTAGSIIRPASYCGVVGFKPTVGEISTQGVKALSETFDTVGLIGRTVEDVSLVFQALRQSAASAVSAVPVKIGVCRTARWSEVRPDGVAVFEGVITALQAAGFQVQQVDIDDLVETVSLAQMELMEWEASRALSWEFTEHPDQLSPQLREYLTSASTRSKESADAAAVRIAQARASFSDGISGVDIVITPATEGEAPPRDTTGNPWFSRAWTALGVPAITLPLGKGENGLPVGVQFIARSGQDDLLLEAASQIAAL